MSSIEEKRAAFEKAMTEGAKWGYRMAELGFPFAPTPVIEWVDDKPRIVGATFSTEGKR